MPCHGKRILIAEDNSTMATVIRFYLEGAGAECVIACNGTEAWKLLQSESFDLLVIDHWMPGMTGSEVCQRLRQEPHLQQLPVVMVTAKCFERELQWLRDELAVKSVITKPFSPRALVLVVEGCLNAASQPQS